ncbi:hypothetical protein FQP82_10955 [Weissella cibaria]|uniref:ABC transporter permease n=1 Tax=Weissella TaxID=46255 RepID=UPI00021915A7|nr:MULTISPECIES: exporter of polyketide antibiotics [Weissella]APS26554.1 hypothetical protein AUC63_00497 [Weissella cibaria]APU61951.1 hypothetical protein AUC65_00102 [Weissella cibaria]APU64102.1 hypothetical protein AUC62_00095 [Weissella cibaria]ASS52516.1 hypothetical protein CHR48_01593 [Weissella cibaria]KXU06060.1 putative tetronasin-transport integral membrane protein ABC transporter [Weissella sp. DD23]
MNRNMWWLLGANLKSDYRVIIVWLLVNFSLIVSGALKLADLYNSPETLDQLLTMLRTPMMTAMFARMPELSQYTVAIVYAAIMLPIMAVLMGLMNVQLVVRGTRQMEESGETELIRGGVTTATTPVLATIFEVLGVNVLMTMTMGIGVVLIPMHGATSGGAILFATLLGTFGLMVAGITLVLSQLFAESRSVNAIGYGVIAVMYVLRAVIDVRRAAEWRWLSPLNWLESARIFADNRAGAILTQGWFAIVLGLIALALVNGRDINAGLIQFAGRGRQRATVWLRGFTSLFVRLQARLVLTWLVGLAFFGAMFGSLFHEVGTMMIDNPQLTKIIGAQLEASMHHAIYRHFLVMVSMFISFLAILAGLNVMQRFHTDTVRGAYDLLGGMRLTRLKLYATYVSGAMIVALCLWGVAFMIVWFTANMVLTVPMDVTMMQQALVGYVPSIAVLIAIAAVLLGWAPRWFGLIYGYAGVMFLMTYMKNLMDLPMWALKLSPYGWTYNVPVVSLSVVRSSWLCGLAVVLLIVGYIGFKKRDLV